MSLLSQPMPWTIAGCLASFVVVFGCGMLGHWLIAAGASVVFPLLGLAIGISSDLRDRRRLERNAR